MNVQATLRRVDRFQQARKWLAFPFAVVKKFGDDQAGNLAALIAYYGFFSMFPLLLVFVSVLGIVLHGHPHLQDAIRHSVLADFPVIGSTLKVNALKSNGGALAIGLVGGLWAGMGVTQAAQNAMNEIWEVKRKDRPNFLKSRLRGLLMLFVLGLILSGSVVLSGLGAAGGRFSMPLRIVGYLGSLVANVLLFLLAYRILTVRRLSWNDVFAGAVTAGILWTVLQAMGGYYVGHQVKNASQVYGTFALVIGLLVWIYLGAQVTLYCAEINVVRVRHLWPRSLVQPPLREADQRALRQGAEVEERIQEKKMDVSFDGGSERSRAATEEAEAPVPAAPKQGSAQAEPGGRRRPFVRSALLGGATSLLVGLAATVRRRRRKEGS